MDGVASPVLIRLLGCEVDEVVDLPVCWRFKGPLLLDMPVFCAVSGRGVFERAGICLVC